MESVKRARVINFSRREIEILIELVERFKQRVENKKMDLIATKEKEDAWEEIHQRYSSRNTVYRTRQTLQKCWDDIKRCCCKVLFDLSETGRRSSKIVEDPLLLKAASFLDVSIVGMYNPYDSDSAYIEGCYLKIKEILKNDCAPPPLNELLVVCENWSEWNPALLRTPNSSVSKPKENRHSPTDPLNQNKNCDFSRRPVLTKSTEEIYFEEKTKLLKLRMEQATKEETRKSELHVRCLLEGERKAKLDTLEIEKKKLEIELLKLELLKAKENSHGALSF